MSDLFVEFGDMYLIRSGVKEGFSVSISVPKQTSEQDFSCKVVFTSSEYKSQIIFGVDGGDCLKLALIYIENILSNPVSYLGGEVRPLDGGGELPIIYVKNNANTG